MLAFTTGTINDVDAPAVGLATAEQLRDDVVAHIAWELVEEFTAASGNVRWYVFRCLATESGLPANFYVVMGRTLATGELRFAICESYDSATHTMSFFAPIGTGSNVVYDASGRNPNTYVLDTAAFNGNVNTPAYTAWTPSGVSTKWWLIVAEDGFTVAFNGASNEFVHLGAYTPLSELSIASPLQIIGSSWANGAITRNPAVASQTVIGMSLEMQGGGSSNSNVGPQLGFRGDIRYDDALQSNLRSVAEQGMNMYVNAPGSQAIYGWALGKQKRMLLGGGSAPAGFAWGDTYDLGGELWVPYKPDDLRIWATGVAS